jgi:hypothetical protein
MQKAIYHIKLNKIPHGPEKTQIKNKMAKK